MRSVAFIVVAVMSIPQAVLGQQSTTPRIPPWPPFAVNSSAVADSSQPRMVSLATAEDRVNAATFTAPGKRTLIGAGVGFVLGAGATWAVLNTGGSTAPCDRDANQDAMSAGECAGVTVLGGVVGALVGALVARLL